MLRTSAIRRLTWRKILNGKDYHQGVPSDRPDLQRSSDELLSALGPKVAAIQDRYAERCGWTANPAVTVWERDGARTMFINSTVLVLGAGASWHYGYPTGEGLVESILSTADRLSGYCQERLGSGQLIQIIPNYVEQKIDPNYNAERPPIRSPLDTSSGSGWEKVRDECKLLIDRLRSVRPILIDHFLAWNETLRPIGKLMIAAAILECEAIWFRERGNQNRRRILANAPLRPSPDELGRLDITKYSDDWCRFVVHKLVYGCRKSSDLLDNDVHFITFNYDTSFEYQLSQALTSIALFKPNDVEKFLSDNRIVHVYGSVHSQIPTETDAIDLETAQRLGKPFARPLVHESEFRPRKVFLDRCLDASKNLRTIDPDDKEEDKEALAQARRWIADSKVVYILGYGFDQNNNRRIGLEPFLSNMSKPSGKAVMFTNYGNINTINKTASNLCYGNYDVFHGDRFVNGNPRGGNYAERSVRTVYEALEKDFYALEAEERDKPE
jgi:hypothetical protein